MINIYYDDRQSFLKIDKSFTDSIEKAIKAVVEMELENDSEYEISVSFVDDKEIKELNRDFRNNDNVTDVLSFPLDMRMDDYIMLGDIVINTKRVTEQAKEFSHSIDREFMYLTVHSMLHLLGYDHESSEDKAFMRSLEKRIMNKLGVYKNEK
ncbi:MAG: rRNA maturation RNase YbeY [Tissierellia bacterium]|nr:rRNA maturation RNase YbeY [Tissierellia bacterium]